MDGCYKYFQEVFAPFFLKSEIIDLSAQEKQKTDLICWCYPLIIIHIAILSPTFSFSPHK